MASTYYLQAIMRVKSLDTD